MSKRKTVVLSGLAVALLLVVTGSAFSQMQGGPGMGGQGRGPGGVMVMGQVDGINENFLIVKTENGATEKLTITKATSFVKETEADRTALAVGETVVVMGDPEGRGAIVPRMVRIVEKIDDNMSRPHGQGGQMMQGGQERGGRMMQGGQAGGGPTQNQSGGQMMGGLVIGAVVGTNPLKIEQTSGTTTVAKLTESTRIVIEKSVDASQVSRGSRIRVLAPSSPGSASRLARKVTILPDMAPAPMR